MEATTELPSTFAALTEDGETTWFLQNRMTIKATAKSTGGAYGLVESWIPAGASPPLHIHRREDEAFWVMEGTVTFRAGDETITARPGSFVFLPRDVPHTFVVDGAEPAHILTLLTPGGGEQFFVDAEVVLAIDQFVGQLHALANTFDQPVEDRVRKADVAFAQLVVQDVLLLHKLVDVGLHEVDLHRVERLQVQV